MHRNYRRKDNCHRNRAKSWTTLPNGYCRLEQRLRWKRARQEVRRLVGQERFELIPRHYFAGIRWDYW